MNPATPYVTVDATHTSERNARCGSGIPGLPLSMAKVGERGRIVSISGKEEVRRFLAELGFTPGTEVKAVSQAGGNLIVDVKGSKIAIDRQMAGKILFSPSS